MFHPVFDENSRHLNLDQLPTLLKSVMLWLLNLFSRLVIQLLNWAFLRFYFPVRLQSDFVFDRFLNQQLALQIRCGNLLREHLPQSQATRFCLSSFFLVF